MMQREKRTPIAGKTLSEMAHEVGAVAAVCDVTRDLELRVISCEARTMGEALKQMLEEGEAAELRRKEISGDEPLKWIDCGTVEVNADGMFEVVERAPMPAPDNRQLKFCFA